jgi:uncharacterized protein (TIGR02266 family)
MNDAADAAETSCVRKAPSGGRVHVEIAIDVASEHTFWADLALAVEKGGVFVATHHVISLGTLVDVELALPDGGRPMKLEGVVRWTRLHSEDSDCPAGVGVKLLDPSPDAQERIARFTRVREPIVFELDEAPPRRHRRPAA